MHPCGCRHAYMCGCVGGWPQSIIFVHDSHGYMQLDYRAVVYTSSRCIYPTAELPPENTEKWALRKLLMSYLSLTW